MTVVVVTGSSGFIGSHVVKQLLQRGYTVHATVRDANDKVKTAHLQHFCQLPECQAGTLKLFSADLDVHWSFDSALAGADVVVHTAASVDITNRDPQAVVDASTKGSANLLASIRKNGTIKRLVHTSSVAAIVRSDYPENYCYSELDYNTHSTIDNGESYNYAKYQGEVLVVEECKKMNLDLVVINPAYVLGESLTKAHTKASPIFVRNLLFQRTQMNLWCCWVDVVDVAAAHAEAVSNNKAVGHRFVLGSDVCMDVSMLGFACKKARPELPWGTPQTFAAPVFGSKYTFNNAQSQQVLGIKYTPFIDTLKSTISSMVDSGFVKPQQAAKL